MIQVMVRGVSEWRVIEVDAKLARLDDKALSHQPPTLLLHKGDDPDSEVVALFSEWVYAVKIHDGHAKVGRKVGRTKPVVGEIVHFVGLAKLNSHGFGLAPKCRTAVIIEVTPIEDEMLSLAEVEHWDEESRWDVVLCVANPKDLVGAESNFGARYDPNKSAVTWHWPEVG